MIEKVVIAVADGHIERDAPKQLLQVRVRVLRIPFGSDELCEFEVTRLSTLWLSQLLTAETHVALSRRVEGIMHRSAFPEALDSRLRGNDECLGFHVRGNDDFRRPRPEIRRPRGGGDPKRPRRGRSALLNALVSRLRAPSRE